MKYNVVIPLHASTSIKVEANSKEEALKKAEQIASEPVLCWHCAQEVEINCINEQAMNDIDLVSEISNDQD